LLKCRIVSTLIDVETDQLPMRVFE
jgi:hypothetical protein